jgi:hypothetical protein
MSRRPAVWSYLVGASAARMGDEMAGPALLLAGLAVTGSASTATALLAGIMASAALGGPVFGVLLDRSAAPGRLLARVLAFYLLGLGLVFVTLGHVPVWVSVAIAAVTGLAGPAISGGWTSQLPRVVPGDGFARANTLDAMTFTLASLVGPGLAGIVAGLAGASTGVVVALVLICGGLPVAWRLPRSGAPAGVLSVASVFADLRAGFQAIFRVRPLARATVVSVFAIAGEGVLLGSSPVIGAHVFGSASRGVILLSACAVASLAANGLLSRYPDVMSPDTVIAVSTVGLAVALALVSIGRPGPVIAGVLLEGFAGGPQLTSLFAVRHREAPDRLRGQVFTTGASLKITAYALGAGMAGPLAVWSLSGALLVGAGIEVLAFVVYAAMSRRGRWTPPPAGGIPIRNTSTGELVI